MPMQKIIVDNMEELTFQSSNMPKWLKKSYATDRPLLKATWAAATKDGGGVWIANYRANGRYFVHPS